MPNDESRPRRRKRPSSKVLTCVCAIALIAMPAGAAEKDTGPPQPIAGATWDRPFLPDTTTLVGSYTSLLRVEQPGGWRMVAFNNTVGGDRDGGLVMWEGPAAIAPALEPAEPQQFRSLGVVFPHRQIDDVFIKGELFEKRRLTRPFITWDPEQGFIGIIHVCADYGPVDGRVYPALVTSKTGEAGTWEYHGKLRGEIWDQFGDESGRAMWADGGGFFYQPEGPTELDRSRPMRNRYLFYSNQYAGPGGIALLMSADGKHWVFHRQAAPQDGEEELPPIVNLTPMLAGRTMIFPHIVRLGQGPDAHGWTVFISEEWPPTAIYRMWSPDGLTWRIHADPDVAKPADLMVKNINGWYDPAAGVLHGYLSVWHQQPDGPFDYNKYHSVTRQLRPVEP